MATTIKRKIKISPALSGGLAGQNGANPTILKYYWIPFFQKKSEEDGANSDKIANEPLVYNLRTIKFRPKRESKGKQVKEIKASK